MIEWRLYLDGRFTGVTVKPDPKYPDKMWRIHRGEEVSDMVNLTRAKDAALTWARERRTDKRAASRFAWQRRIRAA